MRREPEERAAWLLLTLALSVVASACQPARAAAPLVSSPVAAPWPRACDESSVDVDGDGLPDACEAALAEVFAPVVIHSSAESAFPTDVDSFLAKASPAFRDDACAAGRRWTAVREPPTEEGLLHHAIASPCDGREVTSDGSRSDRKHATFFLADVAKEDRRGSADARHWRTYVHAYPNDLGGVTLQYWRFYAYNFAFANHGGDWEAIHVVLGPDHRVAKVRLLGHRDIEERLPSRILWEGTHPVVFSEPGGHTSRASGEDIPAIGCVDSDACVVSLDDLGSFVRQETWTGGRVVWPDGRVVPGGGLTDLGEKSAPKNGQVFVRYSGLWGSPGTFYVTSGYWGPAYNETGMGPDEFVTAWCAGMAGSMDLARECRPLRPRGAVGSARP